MCDRLNRLYDEAWDAYESARPMLTVQQAIWAVETMNKNTEPAYRMVISKLNNAKEKAMSELKQKMARYRELKKECDALEAEIKDAVIVAGETVKGQGIAVTYSAGRKTYDWQSAATKAGEDMDGEAFQEIIENHTTAKVDWKKVATDAGVVTCPFKMGAPSAAIKIVDDEIAPFPEA